MGEITGRGEGAKAQPGGLMETAADCNLSLWFMSQSSAVRVFRQRRADLPGHPRK
jgi:hypothetical protein